jgi:hypothetical protein
MASNSTTKPRILLISLDHQPYFDEMYASLINSLLGKATIQRAKTSGPVMRTLSENPPDAALLTDPALTTRKNSKVWDAVLDYVRNSGTAVCMGNFTSFVKPLAIKPFFQKAGLSWERGEYHRTTVSLAEDHVPPESLENLPQEYSQKALFLANVDDGATWYRQTENSRIESFGSASERVSNVDEVPVAFAKVGQGRLGYVGDVNGEDGSHAVVLAMCGIHT